MDIQQIKIHNSVTAFQKKSYSGITTKRFNVVSGSRIVFTAYCFSKDPGVTVNLKISTSYSEAMPFYEAENIDVSIVGNHSKKVLSDFHNFLDLELEVIGGNAEVIIGLNTFDNALTTRIDNAEIDVDLNAKLQQNGNYDSVRIGNQQYELAINPDGSINTNLVNSSVFPEIVKPTSNKISGVLKDVPSTVVTYTAPAGKQTYLQKIVGSGDNTAKYEIELNGNHLVTKRSYFGGELNVEFGFEAYTENGLELSPGDIVRLRVEHYRPLAGEFEGYIQSLEIG